MKQNHHHTWSSFLSSFVFYLSNFQTHKKNKRLKSGEKKSLLEDRWNKFMSMLKLNRHWKKNLGTLHARYFNISYHLFFCSLCLWVQSQSNEPKRCQIAKKNSQNMIFFLFFPFEAIAIMANCCFFIHVNVKEFKKKSIWWNFKFEFWFKTFESEHLWC